MEGFETTNLARNEILQKYPFTMRDNCGEVLNITRLVAGVPLKNHWDTQQSAVDTITPRFDQGGYPVGSIIEASIAGESNYFEIIQVLPVVAQRQPNSIFVRQIPEPENFIHLSRQGSIIKPAFYQKQGTY